MKNVTENHKIERLVGLFAIVGVIVLATPAALAQTRIAVVDTQRAMTETEEGLRATANLKKYVDGRQRELDRKQDDLQKEGEDISKQKGAISDAALAKRFEILQRKKEQLQMVFLDSNKELQKKQSELFGPIEQKLRRIIQRIATQEGFDMILEKAVVPYVRSDLDITDKVITLHNSTEGASAGSKPGDKSSSTKQPVSPGPALRPATPVVPALTAPTPRPAPKP